MPVSFVMPGPMWQLENNNWFPEIRFWVISKFADPSQFWLKSNNNQHLTRRPTCIFGHHKCTLLNTGHKNEMHILCPIHLFHKSSLEIFKQRDMLYHIIWEPLYWYAIHIFIGGPCTDMLNNLKFHKSRHSRSGTLHMSLNIDRLYIWFLIHLVSFWSIHLILQNFILLYFTQSNNGMHKQRK